MKRFWNEARAETDGEGFAILLDGRPMRLPGGAILRIGSAAVAHAVAAEWAGAEAEMAVGDAKLTCLAATAGRIALDPLPTIEAIARYGEFDLLVYRAEMPAALVARQAAAWRRWLDWAAWRYGAPLLVVHGIADVRQPRASIVALRAAVGAYDSYALAALGVAVPAFGSLILGLALAEGRLDAEAAVAVATVDETFQAENWGEDADAAARRAAIAADVAVAERLLRLVVVPS